MSARRKPEFVPPALLRSPADATEATALAVDRLRWFHGVNGHSIRVPFPQYAAAAAALLGIEVAVIEILMRCGWYQRAHPGEEAADGDAGWWFSP